MRIVNVSADVRSQRGIRQRPMNIGEKVKGELELAEKVEAGAETVQESEAVEQGKNEDAAEQAKGEDARQVKEEATEQVKESDAGSGEAKAAKKGRKTQRAQTKAV